MILKIAYAAIILLATHYAQASLDTLNAQVKSDLLKINIPPTPWMFKINEPGVLDVAIIGGGMGGMAAHLALIREGVTNIRIFDENPPGLEGPWVKTARMHMLRSDKKHVGPALNIPSLTFYSWYEALYGKESWHKLATVPTIMWHDYLRWFRDVLDLPIESNMVLKKIHPVNNLLELTFNDGTVIQTRKVVLATGREGSGKCEVPNCLKDIPKKLRFHTGEIIDAQLFKDKHIAVIGAGASAFDIAAVALENEATAVEMLVRRSAILQYSKISQFNYPGMENGFFSLSDEMRCLFFAEVFKTGIDPSKSAVERVRNNPNLHIHCNTLIGKIADKGERVTITTNKKTFEVDYIISATGYGIDLSQRQELEPVLPYILLWEERVPKELLQQAPILGSFPYLGPYFEFLEKEPGSAPYLKDIYCFNYGAFLSHGSLSGGVGGLALGATRLAQGIATDFFISEQDLHFERIQNWKTPSFAPLNTES